MKAFKIFLIVFFIIVGLVGASLWSGWQHYLTAMQINDRIEAQLSSNKSAYDNMWKSFVEMTQVTDLQAEDFKEVYQGLIDARYDDPNVLFKMVQEQNPQLDTSVYKQLQQKIESGRKEFNNNQKTIADQVREYNGYIRRHFIMTAVSGLQQKDADEYMVLSDQTNGAFDSGKDGAVDLSGGKK